MISVLMSVYNEQVDNLSLAINSILNQTYKDLEFLIVLDSPENVELDKFLQETANKDSRIVIIKNERNIGLARSLNRAFTQSSGEYIARMDSDDISKPERLEKELQYLKTKKMDIVGCICDKIDQSGNKWGTIDCVSEFPDKIRELMTIQNVLVHPTVLMKANVMRELNGYRSFETCQDYDLWLRAISHGYSIGILNENLFQFRRHPNSITATKRFNQIINEKYIRLLYEERRRGNADSFSEANLDAFLRKNGYFDEKRKEHENRKLQKYQKGIKNLKTGKLLSGMIAVLGAMSSPAVRMAMNTSMKMKKAGRR